MKSTSEEREQWKLLLGELVLQFASIESMILDVIIIEATGNNDGLSNRFKKRAEEALLVVKKSSATPKLKSKLLEQIEKAIQLADIRNDFVHNPMRTKLAWVLGETDMVHEVFPPKKNKPHTIKNLEKAVTDTIKCAERLYDLVGRYTW